MNDLLERYGELLGEVDRWFESCLNLHPGSITCRQGCSECCRGLFDITVLDALYLKRGFDLLPEDIQEQVRSLSAARLSGLSRRWPEFREPWILNGIPEDQWDEMMPEEDTTPCPLLSGDGSCRVYAHRPMTCRLNGIPLIDLSGEEFFDEWCSLNFTDMDPTGLVDMRYPFNDLFSQELLLFHELTRRISGCAVGELDTIIPAAVFLHENQLRLLKPPHL